MRRQHRLLNSENHVGEDLGDIRGGIRTDFEDAMVLALEDTLLDQRLTAFRSFIVKWRKEWPDNYYQMMMTQDDWAWYTVYWLTCTLRRMGHRWEHAANKLKDTFAMDPQQIPMGQEFLYR